MEPSNDKTLTLDEVMQELDLGRAEVYRRVKDGDLAVEKTGRTMQFACEDVRKFKEAQRDKEMAFEGALGEQLDLFALRVQEEAAPAGEGPPCDTDEEKVNALLDLILADGLRMGAEDIYLDPMEEEDRLLYRHQGKLEEIERFPSDLACALKDAVKGVAQYDEDTENPPEIVMAREIQGATRQIGIQVAPTLLGEHVHLHIFNPESVRGLRDVGYLPQQATVLRELLENRLGLLLMAGPADPLAERHRLGLVSELSGMGRLVVSLEHRAHCRSELLVQLRIGEEDGQDFAAIAKVALRMSPDVLIVDDVRTLAEAQTLAGAGSGGALVIAKIGASGAADAIRRLIDLELPCQTLAPVLLAVAERATLRRLCAACRVARAVREEEAALLRCAPTAEICERKGCEICGDGFEGRRMIHGLRLVGSEMTQLLRSEESLDEALALLDKDEPLSLRAAAREAVLNGDVSLDEAQLALRGSSVAVQTPGEAPDQ